MDALLPNDTLNEITFTYDGPSACLLPVDVQSDGILGCPTRITQIALSSGASRELTLAYDAAGRLVERTDPDFRRSYEWAGKQVVSVTYKVGNHPPFVLRYVEAEDSATLVKETAAGPETTMQMRFAGARLVDVELPNSASRMTLTWDDSRLSRLDWLTRSGETYYRVLYDCAP